MISKKTCIYRVVHTDLHNFDNTGYRLLVLKLLSLVTFKDGVEDRLVPSLRVIPDRQDDLGFRKGPHQLAVIKVS